MKTLKKTLATLVGATALISASAVAATEKPNVLVIWGDDIGMYNISAYNHGMMGYETPNIDRLADEGGLFTDHYAQQSCTAGRAAFMMGQHPVRTGMLTIGMPGSAHGIPEWTPTIADLLKEQGYMTAQHGKNHFGDRDEHLPTNHGFDQFFGNLYHLNAEEEPETYYYPKDAEFHQKYGPRGVLKSYADGRVEDTGPMTRKRMENADEEFLAETLQFIDKAHAAEKPFFIWHNATRMHVWTRLQEKYQGITGVGLYADGMVEHDDHVGILLKKLDDLGIADETVVIYSTDNGAEKFSWPDGGQSPFNGEKGTTSEGGVRVPQLVRWPGVIEPGSRFNGITSHEDWMPTLLAAAGEPQLVEKLKSDAGYNANGKNFRIHPDGYNMLPYLSGEQDDSARENIFYFDASGNLNAVRWNDFKGTFAELDGDIMDATRKTPNWPIITNLRADPFERAHKEAKSYMRWHADNMWLFVPIGEQINEFLGTFDEYPFQASTSLNPANISVNSLMMEKRIAELEKQVAEK